MRYKRAILLVLVVFVLFSTPVFAAWQPFNISDPKEIYDKFWMIIDIVLYFALLRFHHNPFSGQRIRAVTPARNNATNKAKPGLTILSPSIERQYTISAIGPYFYFRKHGGETIYTDDIIMYLLKQIL